MATDKRINYDVQGGVKNYLGKQKEVKAPLHWRSGPKHPSTELAYITKKEKDLLIKKDLHRSLKGGVNRGPSGIISLNGWGSRDSSQNRAGADMSAGMDKSASDKGWSSGPGGFTNRDAMSPATEKALEAQQNARLGIDPTARENKWGGLGGLLRGALGIFGGIPGRIASVFSRFNPSKLRGINTVTGEPNTQEEYEQMVNDRKIQGRIDSMTGRMLEGKTFSQKNLDSLLGQTQTYGANVGENFGTNLSNIDKGRYGKDSFAVTNAQEITPMEKPNQMNYSNALLDNWATDDTDDTDDTNYSNQLGNLYPGTGLGAADGGLITLL